MFFFFLFSFLQSFNSQNARQKQRKIYENQPNNTLYESEEKKSSNINYTCKKCNLVFQRYYELIRHQKNHCFKEENNKKSAKAQIAAAQIAQSLSSEDSNSSLEINHANNLLGNNLLHPVSTTKQSQQNLIPNLDATAKNLNLPKMNLNHPVNLLTTSGTPNIMVNDYATQFKTKKKSIKSKKKKPSKDQGKYCSKCNNSDNQTAPSFKKCL